jgi:hypothetical protein
VKSGLHAIFALLITSAISTQATVIQHIGNWTEAEWGTVTWNAIDGLDDPDDGEAEQLDFVGNSSTPGAYWGIDNNYVYFRMRLAAPTPSFSDSHFVLLNIDGDVNPDYAFVWDSKSNDPDTHGLEMSIFSNAKNATWGGITMDDLDGSKGSKGEVDINGGERSTDGYVQSTTGTDSSFLDFAVSLSYLSNYVPVLVQNTDWGIQFASIANATDHNALSADIAGGDNPSSTITADSWSTIAIPEPTVATLVILFGSGVLVSRRIFTK